MALMESNMLDLGTIAPDFNLPDTVSGKQMTLQELRSEKATVLMFICNHCPYVIHVNKELVRLANDYIPKGVSFVAISSNDVSRYPQDGPAEMKEFAKENNYPFPYLYDASQEVARVYDAACTPDFYLFDEKLVLQYRGRMDDSRPNSGTPLSGKDLRAALDAILEGNRPSEVQYPSAGCSIKWIEN